MVLGLPRGKDGELSHATVKRSICDEEGRRVGRAHANPMLDSR